MIKPEEMDELVDLLKSMKVIAAKAGLETDERDSRINAIYLCMGLEAAILLLQGNGPESSLLQAYENIAGLAPKKPAAPEVSDSASAGRSPSRASRSPGSTSTPKNRPKRSPGNGRRWAPAARRSRPM